MGSRSRVGTNRNERRRSEPVKWYTRRGAEAVEGAWQCAPAAAAGFVVRMCARAERRGASGRRRRRRRQRGGAEGIEGSRVAEGLGGTAGARGIRRPWRFLSPFCPSRARARALLSVGHARACSLARAAPPVWCCGARQRSLTRNCGGAHTFPRVKRSARATGTAIPARARAPPLISFIRSAHGLVDVLISHIGRKFIIIYRAYAWWIGSLDYFEKRRMQRIVYVYFIFIDIRRRDVRCRIIFPATWWIIKHKMYVEQWILRYL